MRYISNKWVLTIVALTSFFLATAVEARREVAGHAGGGAHHAGGHNAAGGGHNFGRAHGLEATPHHFQGRPASFNPGNEHPNTQGPRATQTWHHGGWSHGNYHGYTHNGMHYNY